MHSFLSALFGMHLRSGFLPLWDAFDFSGVASKRVMFPRPFLPYTKINHICMIRLLVPA